MLRVKKYIGLRTLKTAFGAGLGIFFAHLLNLNYGVNTAIVVILSLQNTKRKSLNLAGVRILASVIALSLAKLVFTIFGFGPISFSIYLLLFIPIVVRLRLNEGLVPSSVLVSHLLASNSVTFGSLANEFAQMVIGASIALVLNLYIPGLESHLINDLAAIKRIKYRILESMRTGLMDEYESADWLVLLEEMSQRIDLATERVLNETGENFNRGLDYHLRYLKMESDQLESLRFMNRSVRSLSRGCELTRLAAELSGKALTQLKSIRMDREKIQEIKGSLELLAKPTDQSSMEEFQARAAAFQYLEDLVRLLDIRTDFVDSLSYSDRKLFREMHSKIREMENAGLDQQ
ncbi:aromatic acid exporter family protein [Gudongella sp. SC589]|uniref:aromatic acid exporter family protein n=1 Tax=Gudongella sp. SC589 TaxID=3385990 RepID=UPI0039047023